MGSLDSLVNSAIFLFLFFHNSFLVVIESVDKGYCTPCAKITTICANTIVSDGYKQTDKKIDHLSRVNPALCNTIAY